MGYDFKGIYNIWEKNINLFEGDSRKNIEETIAFDDLSNPELEKIMGEKPANKLREEIELISDSSGIIGKDFKVCRGWNPDDKEMNPYIKLFGMLLGLGAWATLPCVISGYIGNPFIKQPWIEAALAQGQSVGRWPNNVIEFEAIVANNPSKSNTETVLNVSNKFGNTKFTSKIKSYKFNELPYVNKWGRKPLELATLRLQNMIGISLSNWDVLKPTQEELNAGVLTQLGGCIVVDKNMNILYQWKDQGICHVANFEDIVEKLETKK
jgi:hypothetical protein